MTATTPMTPSSDNHEHGDAQQRIAAATAVLDDLAAQPLAAHAPAYESLHERLQAELAEIDSA